MKNFLKNGILLLAVIFAFSLFACKAESGDDASIPVTTQEKPTNQPQPTPQPQAGTYIVQHYQQDTTGDGYTLFETERLTGTAGEQTKAAAKTYEHFSAKTFSQAEIKADGSTVIRIDYDREIITLIFDKADESANWNDEWIGQAQEGKITIKGRYGANVAAPTIPKKTGYGTSWNKDVQTTFASNETYTAQYTEGQVNYTVEHWLENLENDEYTKHFTEDDKTGTIGAQTEATAKAYEGFVSLTVTQATIALDGSTVVQIRYARKRYMVSFETNGAGTVTSQNVKHGGKVGEPAALTKTGYNFKGWFTSRDGGSSLASTAFDFGVNTITTDVVLYAKWEIKTFTVTFDSKGGSEVVSQTVEYGSRATAKNSERLPYDFVGWFLSADGGRTLMNTAFDFANTLITNNVTLYAKWYLDLSNCTADNVASKIAAMTESGTVVVTGEITGSTLNAIKRAINAKTFAIEIDLSGTSGVTSIEMNAFSGCSGLTSINLPSGVTSIGLLAFSRCSGLTSINLPSGLTSIGGAAFDGCSGLTSIELPSGLTSIGMNAFCGCSSLTSIELPSGLTSIGSSAFFGCSGLTSISIPSGVTSIGDSAFSRCSGLTSINLSVDNTEYISIDGVLYSKDKTKIIAYPCGKSATSYEILESVTSICNSAFSGCSGLTSISIPSGVTSIGSSAFSRCSELTSISIPSGVTSIGNSAFSGCRRLKTISFAGTTDQWNSIEKNSNWNKNVPATKVVCSNGSVNL